MGGLVKGLADGMQDSRSRDAESAASSSALDAINSRNRATRAESKVNAAIGTAEAWKARAEELTGILKKNTAEYSGCLIVINAMIKTMEEDMSPEHRERFRDRLVQRARARMQQVDAERKGRGDYLSLEGTFKALDQNKALGVV